jgi:hypothetical protein
MFIGPDLTMHTRFISDLTQTSSPIVDFHLKHLSFSVIRNIYYMTDVDIFLKQSTILVDFANLKVKN